MEKESLSASQEQAAAKKKQTLIFAIKIMIPCLLVVALAFHVTSPTFQARQEYINNLEGFEFLLTYSADEASSLCNGVYWALRTKADDASAEQAIDNYFRQRDAASRIDGLWASKDDIQVSEYDSMRNAYYDRFESIDMAYPSLWFPW